MILKCENRSSPTSTCKVEEYKQICESEKVQTTVREVTKLNKSLLSEQSKSNPDQALIDGWKAEKKKKKAQLPVFLYNVQSMENNHRCKENSYLNGLYMADFDHIGKVSEWVKAFVERTLQHPIAEGEDYLSVFRKLMTGMNILLVHVTPSGDGLRFVCKANIDMNLWENQQHLGSLLDLKPDEACKDACRVSLAVPKNYIIHFDEELFTYYNPEYDARWGASYRGKYSKQPKANLPAAGKAPQDIDNQYNISGEQKQTLIHNIDTTKISSADAASELAETENYDSMMVWDAPETVEFQDINLKNYPADKVIMLWESLNGGEPKEGSRNITLFKLACQLKYLVGNNRDELFKILPGYGLDDKERYSVAKSACNRPLEPCLPTQLQYIIDVLDKTVGNQQKVNLDMRFQHLYPNLPPAMKAACDLVDDDLRIGAIMAALPMWFTLMTKISFTHYDNTENRLSGMTFVIGPAASGKSFILSLADNILKVLIDEAEMVTEAENSLNEAVVNTMSEPRATAPLAIIRKLPIQISNAKLSKRLHKAKDYEAGKYLHCITVESELETQLRADKGGAWIEKTDLYCKAFHNEKWGTDYASADSTNGEIPIYYNLVVSGTDESFQRFIPKQTTLSGLPTRIMLYNMPPRAFKMIEYKPAGCYDEQKELLQNSSNQLLTLQWQHVDASPLTQRMWQWCAQLTRRAYEKMDFELDDLRRRTPLMAIRAGICYAILEQLNDFINGKPLIFSDNCLKFAEFIGDYCLYSQYDTFAGQMKAQKKRVELNKGERLRIPTASDMEYNKLEELFTVGDVKKLMPTKTDDAVRSIIKRWKEKGYIISEAPQSGKYKKLISSL